ncbi:hypothetical protein TNCV_1684031 [Trichonephila clavipes]|nr:hypothetical protein TNCV_1684031 [Trichonephila clavipes]
MTHARGTPSAADSSTSSSTGMLRGTCHPDSRRASDRLLESNNYVRGGTVGYRSRVSSKHLSLSSSGRRGSIPRDQKGVALQLQDARVGVGSTKDADRCWEWLRYSVF